MRARVARCELADVAQFEAEDPVEAKGIERLHLVLFDGFTVDVEFGTLEFRDHFIATLAVAEQEKELMDKQLVIGVLIIRIHHTLLILEFLLHDLDVLLKVLALPALALEHGPVLLDPGADQLIAHRLVDESEGALDYAFFQGDVGLFEFLLYQGECVNACSNVLDRQEIAPVQHDRSGNQFDITHSLSMVEVL